MTTWLLDSNALIALVLTDHEHHPRAVSWAGTDRRVAVCPIVEGALVRFLVRVGEHPRSAVEVLTALRSSPRVEHWPETLSYADVDLGHLTGHRQVTDAYLAALARAHDGRLATFDTGLAAALPDRVDLIP